MLSAAALVALMLHLLPSAPRERLDPIAEAIRVASHTREEAVTLLVISYSEDTFGRAGVPFGACSYLCEHRCGHCRHDVALADVARWSLGLLRHADARCGPHASLEMRLGWYHTGHCRADPFSRREASLVESLLERREARADR